MTDQPNQRSQTPVERALRADSHGARYPPTPDIARAVDARLRQRSSGRPRHARQLGLLLFASVCFVLVGALLAFVFRDTDEDSTPQTAASPEATTINASPTATDVAEMTPPQALDEQLLVVSSGYRSPEDGHEQLLLVDPDDGSLRHLTNQPGEHTMPSLSPDGTRVVFVGDRDGTTELYVLTIADGAVQRLTNNDWPESAPTWSPAGDRIAFDCYPDGASGQVDSRICLIAPDGSNLHVIREDDLHGHSPVWSPDGDRLAFTGYDGASEDLYIVDAEGSEPRVLLPDGLHAGSFLTWSPDGTQVAYESWRTDAHGGIYVINTDGTNDHPLTDPPFGTWPAWSPDGARIAFINWFDGERYGLYVAGADGSNPQQLADDLGYAITPAWSPDGDEIAIVNGSTLEVFSADGSARRTLATGLATASTVHWQPMALPPAPVAPTPAVTETPTAPLPTLEEVYAGLQATLSQPGSIVHLTITTTPGEGSVDQGGSEELWIDATRDLARVETIGHVAVAGMEVTFDTTSITAQGTHYTLYREPESRLDTGRARSCYGAMAAVATILRCPGATESSTTTVEWGTWQGQPALALVTIGTSRGSDEQFTFTERTFLDPETFVPLARQVSGTHSWGPMDTTSVYQHEFVDAAAVAPDHFDPIALAIERLDMTDPTTPLYWLGTRVQPVTDLPPLVLLNGGPVVLDEDDDALLAYRLEEPHFTLSNTVRTEVVLRQWSRAAWEQGIGDVLRAFWADDECGQTIEIELDGGQAAMFLGFLGTSIPSSGWVGGPIPTPNPSPSCVEEPYQRFEAVVTFDETVVFLYLPEESAYRSAAGLEAIVRALQRR